ncbi:MAG TPA: glycosyltransferase family 1 protein [Gordonia polyisoprenivorans]|uniref:glycosyltransferase n=1 Tax=Gordonia polyisoprenivorans TaxID=84595 RepID=UPI000B99EB35|nr:glycosyltransferase [Gordonia polyisoprenivorans]OZC33811.1 hypothetical protein CJJ17_21685 [Gordonia polyisoprenivorans]HCS57708.1 glycosyltransferase family 1 protein [Gordonia polyisoprenivorans]
MPSCQSLSSPLRVASVPASHVYVRHLASSSPDTALQRPVIRLPDPVPADGATVPGGWWPPLMLDPRWIADHADDFDVFHLHFGFDAIAPDTIAAVIGELDRHGKPLVYTVHDLRNPHHPEPGAHEQALDLLIPAATRVITLTPGAAEEISSRWGREAAVLPHPHVVPETRLSPTRPRHTTTDEPFVVGVHTKSVRANMDPLPVIHTLLEAAAQSPDIVIRIDAHDEIFEPGNHWYNPDFGVELLALANHPRARVQIHPYFDDTALWDYLAGLSASVLPYRFGTHSGWLEACHDLGTAVIAPSCGYYHQQQDCATFDFTESTFAEESLAQALDEVRQTPTRRPSRAERLRQRDALADAHRDLYAGCVDG